MKNFVHPSAQDITLSGILTALADPMRIRILRKLIAADSGKSSCCDAAPCPKMAKSTLSNHFRILREAGLIKTVKNGVENHNSVRLDEVESRFPGLIDTILKFEGQPAS